MRKVYYFTLEAVLAALFIFPYFGSVRKPWDVFVLLSASIILFSLFTFFLEYFEGKAKILFFLIIFPAIFLAGKFTGHPYFWGIIIGLFIFWRGISLTGEEGEERELPLLAAAMIALLPAIIFAAMKNEKIVFITIILSLIELVLAIGGRFITNFARNSDAEGQKRGYLTFFAVISGALIVIGLIFSAAMDIIQASFFFTLKGIAMLMTLLASPLFGWLEGKKFNFESKNALSQERITGDEETIAQGHEGANLVYSEFILFAFGLTAVIVIFIYLYKKKLNGQFPQFKNTSPGLSIQNAEYLVSLKKKKNVPPEDPLRKEFFYLELFANKIGYGRGEYETLQEWWGRIDAEDNAGLIELYEQVRYGRKQVSEAELEAARRGLHSLRNHMKLLGDRRLESKKGKSSSTL